MISLDTIQQHWKIILIIFWWEEIQEVDSKRGPAGLFTVAVFCVCACCYFQVFSYAAMVYVIFIAYVCLML